MDRLSDRALALVPSGVISGYSLDRERAFGPGLWLFDARTAAGEPILLQLVVLRAADSDNDRVARDLQERKLWTTTQQLLAREPASILDFGSSDAPSGERLLFWTLPWVPSAEKVASLGAEIALVELGLALARELAERHVRGRATPQLTEHALERGDERLAARMLGLPLVIGADWLVAELLPTRLAPEETLLERCEESGDLWRLGQLLTALAIDHELSPELSRLLERLAHAQPAQRPSRATEVIVALEAQLADFIGRAAMVVLDTVRLEALAPGELDQLLLKAGGASTVVEAAALPSSEPEVVFLSEIELAPAVEAPQPRMEAGGAGARGARENGAAPRSSAHREGGVAEARGEELSEAPLEPDPALASSERAAALAEPVLEPTFARGRATDPAPPTPFEVDDLEVDLASFRPRRWPRVMLFAALGLLLASLLWQLRT
ncbi:MAG: hypothetical protein IT384_03110 [Deltaproteobacteria bacterium]|nr:hypothetical protein [Deltaproteobacteria bacterium]